MPKYILLLVLAVTPSFAQITKADVDYVNSVFYPATVLLYSQDDHGGMHMRCTATAIDKLKENGVIVGREFVTAAHCACKDDEDKELAQPAALYFFVTRDDKDEKKFITAKLRGCGYQHKGHDFALFDVKTKDEYPLVELGKDPVVMEPVINVASPLGLCKQVFVGSVTAPVVDREIVQGSINWTQAVLVQIPGTDGGSSGSSIVCLDQKAICAFLVGTDDDTTDVAMPVSRMLKFKEQLDAGKYKYWKDDTEPVHEKAEPKASKK